MPACGVIHDSTVWPEPVHELEFEGVASQSKLPHQAVCELQARQGVYASDVDGGMSSRHPGLLKPVRVSDVEGAVMTRHLPHEVGWHQLSSVHQSVHAAESGELC